jgi:hypothetical protein
MFTSQGHGSLGSAVSKSVYSKFLTFATTKPAETPPLGRARALQLAADMITPPGKALGFL